MSNQAKVQEIRDHGEGRMVCPWCGGGSTKEPCMSVSTDASNPAVLWATCYRNNCDIDTVRVLNDGVSYTTKGTKVSSGLTGSNTYKFPTAKLADGFYPAKTLENSYYLHFDWLNDMGVRVNKIDSSELVFPVRALSGKLCGHTVKRLSLSAAKTKKAHNYFAHEEWDGGAPVCGPERSLGEDALDWVTGVVLVEDMLSAHRIVAADDSILAIALLGTAFPAKLVRRLREVFTEEMPITMALDPDAIGTAIKYAVSHCSSTVFKVARLPKDPKDMSPNELDRLLAIVLR